MGQWLFIHHLIDTPSKVGGDLDDFSFTGGGAKCEMESLRVG